MNATPEPFERHQRVTDTDRERVAQALLAAMTDGRLTHGETDELVAKAYAATTIGDLTALLTDLGVGTVAVLTPPPARVQDTRIGGRPGSHLSVAVFGSVERTGGWTLPAVHSSFCYLGNVTIDLREAQFARPRCTIVAVSILGDIKVIVPPDITVRISGTGLIDNFTGRSHQGSPAAPVVRVMGLALLGEIVVVSP
jgi:hypothetical protein